MADKSFGVQQLDIIGTGTPTIQSPNDLNINADTVAISTSLSIGNRVNISSGIITASSGIVTYYGDGSNLTGISGDKISEGNTEVETIDTGSDGHVKFTTEGTERVRITSSGDVAINRTTALNTCKFSITKDADEQAIGIQLNQSSGITTSLTAFNSSGSNIFDLAHDTDSTPDLLFKLKHSSDVASVEKLRITSDGNVGIKSTAPRGRLDIEFDGAPSFITFGADADNPKVEFFRSTGGSPSHYATEFQQVLGDFVISTAASANLGSHSYSEKLRIKSNGNVGIGTDNPQRLLHLQSTGDTLARITSADGSAAYLELGDVSDPDGGKIVYDSGSNLTFYSASSERLRITSSGDVGIGEDSPVAKVHIAGSNYVSVGGGGFDSNVVLAITRNFTVGQSAGLALNSGTSGASFIHLGDADDPDIGKITYDHSSNYLAFTVNTGERLRIDSNGDVSIGVDSNPGGNRLLVVDSRTDAFVNPSDSILRITNENTSADTNQASISFTCSSTGVGADSAIVSQAEDASGNSNLQFWTDTSNGMSEKLRIDSDGRVRINGADYAYSANVGGDDLIIGDDSISEWMGLTIASSSGYGGMINFGDASHKQGYIQYRHNGDRFEIGTAGSERLRIDSSGGTTITTEGDTVADSFSLKVGQTNENDNSGSGPHYGLLVNQLGARYHLNIGVYSEVLGTNGLYTGMTFDGMTKMRSIGVVGISTVSSEAYQKGIGVYGKVLLNNYNYNDVYGVKGLARPGTGGFSNNDNALNFAGYGGHFVAHGKGQSIGVYADAYLDSSPGANQEAIPLKVASNGTELVRVTSTGLIGLGGANYGTSGQVLTSNGSSSAPTWQTVSGGGGGGSGFFAQTTVGIHTLSKVGIGTTNPQAQLEINVGSAVTAFDIQGSQGQLFSVTNNLSSGSIFSVNDISGMPSIDVDANGTIQLAPLLANDKVGIGTTNPDVKLEVVGDVIISGIITSGGNITFANITSPSGSESRIHSTTEGNATTGTLVIEGKQDIQFKTGGFNRWKFDGGDLVTHGTTYRNIGNTSNSGGRVGNGYFQYSVDLIDDAELRLGDSDDLTIWHDGSNSYIHNDNGNLKIQNDSSNSAGDIQILNDTTTAIANNSFSYSAKFISGGSVELYHNGSKKLSTTSTGIDVTGGGVFSSAITASTYIQGTSSNGGLKFYSDSSASKGVVLNTDDHLVPSHDSSSDLGLTGTRWRNVYADTLYGDGSNIVAARWTLGANGFSHYTFTGPGGLSSTDDPVIYLARGQTYEFVNNSGGFHPFQIRVSNGGSAYSTGVTNNGASSGTIKFEVPFSAPNTLYYQCTSHSGMGNTIVVYPDLNT